ncbi:MAG: sigma-54 dependent transcriptional regulator [Acidobacteria bacterium]|jgi:two-component system nitrogen regulation response regulator NtrX|nr:sigma-54 dependent transcriptional regulator [Acidobacteriota bacterium]
MKPRVLVVDDEEAVRSSLRMIFEYEGYEVLLAANGPAGLKMAEQDSPDLVFLDIKMPQMDGLEVLKRLKADEPSPPVVILSGHGTVKTAVEAVKLGAFDFIEKPPESERILIVTRNALGQKRLVDENRRLRLSFDDRYRMVGRSAALEKVWDAIRRAAPTNATVLLTGESGVGKELAARAIHSNSLRQDEAFVQVNCAAIPEELIESELFGHEKGSFTGAAEKQIGKFELAHRGTIFLDEVGDMSLRTQAKVLRVLQEGEVERIGSQKTIQVDVRVIAATNKTLEEEIEAGRFREDLYFRLSVLPIRVPPLRERPEDVEPLIEHFVQEFCSVNNFRPKAFAPPAMEALKRHPWRGNVRELKNVVERLLIMAEGDEVRAEDVSGVLRRPTDDAAALSAAGTLRDFKEAAERTFLVAKLRESNWNISATAQAIGTPRSNLYKKLDQYGISQESDG